MSTNIVPILTSDSQNGYIVTYSSGSAGYAAFNGIADGTSFYRSSIAPALPENLTLTLNRTFNITGYKIYLGYYHNMYSNMSTWDFQGLVEGVWTTLHSSSHTQIAEALSFDIEPVNVTAVRIVCKTRFGSNSWGMDEIEVYGTFVPTASVGGKLLYPDPDWKRYDSKFPLFQYSSATWSTLTSSNYYNGSTLETITPNNILSFSFIGSKLRVIAALAVNRSSNNSIIIDGVEYQLNEYSSSLTYQALVFEIQGLEFKNHTVQIKGSPNLSSAFKFSIDAIDIDSTGMILHPSEVTRFSQLEIGKRIRAHYLSVSNTFGVFSNLGKETYRDGSNEFISDGSPAPNGDFYFFYVGDDFLGRKVLVADRNIQGEISWDTLNAAGIASGSGLPLQFNAIPIMVSDILPEGAASSSSVYSAANPAWKAFNGNTSEVGWVGDPVSWLRYQFSSSKVINGYAITSRSDLTSNQNPKNWTFEGSNDGTSWTVLDTRSDITSWSTKETKTFTFNNNVSYLYYRINIAANNGGATTAIAELQMFEKVNYNLTMRLLTGGINGGDKDSEWDEYIVKSSLNGTIPGSAWNVASRYSLTSTSYSIDSANKSTRGSSSIDGYTYIGTTITATNYSNFRPVLIVENLIDVKILVQDGVDIKKYENGWQVVGTAPVTEEMFNNGMSKNFIETLAPDVWHQLTNNQPKILCWTSESESSYRTDVRAVPFAQLILPEEDIVLPLQGAASFAVASSVSGSGIIKIIASVDEGLTWVASNGESWLTVFPDTQTVGNFGMPSEIFNAIREEQWSQLIGESNSIRFAYYLDQSLSTDVASVDAVSISCKPASSVTPIVNQIEVSYEELTVEGRLKDLEQLNAINMAKLEFKANILMQSSKYKMHNMVIDTFDTNSAQANPISLYDSVTKSYKGVGIVVMDVEVLSSSRKLIIISADQTDCVFEYSVDAGVNWHTCVIDSVIDISSLSGNSLTVRVTLPYVTSELSAISYAWA